MKVSDEVVEVAAKAAYELRASLRWENAIPWEQQTSAVQVLMRNEARAALEAALAQQPQGWRPIESAPKTSEVVLFCDSRGNRWTQCADNWDVPECGLPASYWMPLPASPEPGVG